MRELYREMFGAPKVDTEWLPEIPQNIEAAMPEALQKEIGDTLLSGWPFYDPQKSVYGSWGNTYWKQLNLGNFQKQLIWAME